MPRFLRTVRDLIQGAPDPARVTEDPLDALAFEPDDPAAAVELALEAEDQARWEDAYEVASALLRDADAGRMARLRAGEVAVRAAARAAWWTEAEADLRLLLPLCDEVALQRVTLTLRALPEGDGTRRLMEAVAPAIPADEAGVGPLPDGDPARFRFEGEEPDGETPLGDLGFGALPRSVLFDDDRGGRLAPLDPTRPAENEAGDAPGLPVPACEEWEGSAAEPLPFLEFGPGEAPPIEARRFVVSNPAEPGREILRRFADSQAERADPARLESMYDQGIGFFQMGSPDTYELAVRCLAPLASVDHPNRLGAVEVLAQALRELGRSEEASRHLRAALPDEPRGPEYAVIFHWLGRIAEERGRAGDAIAHYGRAVSLDPGLAEAKGRLRVLIG